MSRRRQVLRAIVRGALIASATVMAAALVVVLVAAAVGYRPVVILTGSMGDTAPPGSLAIAAPVEAVEVGDVLVMRGADRATVTHRVIDIEAGEGGDLLAVTRGDANPDRDIDPYVLGDEELVVEWVLPEAGRLTLAIRNPMLGIALLSIVVGAFVVIALRRIWAPPAEHAASTAVPAAADVRGSRWRRFVRPRPLVGATVAGATLVTGGVAMSLYVGIDSVAANQFSTLPCFESRLDDVQRGQATISTDGVTTVPVLAVDPTTAFLLFSVSSASSDPDRSTVLGRLASPTEIEFVRASDDVPPGDVVVEWSLVEYACGLTVQRGETGGDGSSQLDVAISSVDPARSFVIGTSVAASGATTFDRDEIATVELADATTVRFTSASALPVGAVYGWQVVTFDHPSDGSVQHLTGSLGAGASTSTIAIPAPVDPATTLVLASVRSSNGGSAIGDRMVRARLLDDSTVELERRLTVGTVDVHVQIVELGDGSTVGRGVLELAGGDATATATIAPVATSRSTAISTVLIAGGHAGGSTDQAVDDVAGEGSARVRLIDATTLEVRRDSTASAASFAWQVVTWGGPTWADLDAPFRRRIDVTAGSVLAPDGYTTSFEVDHADLVGLDASLPDGDDLRVWRFDGAAWTELDRVLDDDSTWNAADTTIWFRTQEAIAAGTTISYWLYFGDPVPDPPLADPANVWLATEGFDDGTLGVFEDRTGGTGWYAADPWTVRIELTVDAAAVATDLTDQQVLVRLTDAALASAAQTDGSDLRFTAADGLTALPHELEAYDSTTGTVTAWVRVPTLSSSTPTVFHLYAGAPNAPDQSDPRSTWAGAGAVWQLAADPGGDAPTLADSGSWRLDGIALADAALVASPTGPAIEFDGALDRLESTPGLLPAGPITVSTWFNADAAASDAVLVAQGDPTSAGVFELAIDATASPTARFRLRIDGIAVEATGGSIVPGAWHHLVATWDGATARVYLDGVEVGSSPAAGSVTQLAATAVVIGADPGGADAFDGRIGQVRIDDVAHSADRIAFGASNLADGSTVTVGPLAAGTWHDQGAWTTRRPLTVDADLVAGTIADYPLLVQLTDGDLAASSQPDGDDLVFTAADGVTRLDHFVESWDGATGAITAWVRVPLLDGSVDTRLYLYTSNASAVDQQDPIGVWGADADLVLTGARP